MMDSGRWRNGRMIPCQLLCGGSGGLLSCKDSPVIPLSYTEDTRDGSLPGSQNSELDEDDDEEECCDSRGSTSPTTDTPNTDPLTEQTRHLLITLFRGDPDTKADNTLHRVTADIRHKHRMAFQGMLQRLSIETEDDIQKLSEVPSMVFDDGITNWGRIVTLISFGAFVAKHLESIKLENCIRQMADNFTDYLMTQKREWIVQHDGWEGCVQFFHVEDYESGIKTVLMAFAGVASIGASLAYMIR